VEVLSFLVAIVTAPIWGGVLLLYLAWRFIADNIWPKENTNGE
jgi:hypothetical protein